MSPNREFIASAVVAIAGWTLFCLIGWLLIAFGGAVIETFVEIVFFWFPGLADALQAVVRFLSSIGGGVIAAVWALGAATIGFGTWLLRHGDGTVFVYRESAYYGPNHSPRSNWSPGDPPMKDVTPPREDDQPPRDGQGRLPRE
jgi:hypothetical protein